MGFGDQLGASDVSHLPEEVHGESNSSIDRTVQHLKSIHKDTIANPRSYSNGDVSCPCPTLISTKGTTPSRTLAASGSKLLGKLRGAVALPRERKYLCTLARSASIWIATGLLEDSKF